MYRATIQKQVFFTPSSPPSATASPKKSTFWLEPHFDRHSKAVSRKQKATPPADRAAILEQIRHLAADHFDCGLAVFSWEESGETFHLETHFGNRYAVENLAEKTHELLFPFEEEEEEEEA